MTNPTNRGVVLLIEDEESIAEMLRTVFEREGYRLIHSLTGQAGLDRLRERQPKAVLLDLNLPDIDGVDVCRKIRADHDVPVIMLTARDTEIDKISERNRWNRRACSRSLSAARIGPTPLW